MSYRIKPLEWLDHQNGSDRTETYIARPHAQALYQCERTAIVSSKWWANERVCGAHIGSFPTLDAAQAACEAHHRQQVEALLEPEEGGELDRLRAENDTLRAIAARIMPCHYCGAQSIGECRRSFPGCALGDDINAGEDAAHREIGRLRADKERLDWLERTRRFTVRGNGSAGFSVLRTESEGAFLHHDLRAAIDAARKGEG